MTLETKSDICVLELFLLLRIPVRPIMSILKTKRNNKWYKVHRNITALENILPLIELFASVLWLLANYS